MCRQGRGHIDRSTYRSRKYEIWDGRSIRVEAFGTAYVQQWIATGRLFFRNRRIIYFDGNRLPPHIDT